MAEKTFIIEEELKKLPGKPGVYLMHDKNDHIIYVGKAINLKNRVRQYFQTSRNVTVKIQCMIEKIAWFEYIVTDSELEALVLENNLIKEYNPKYNTLLKDGKSYPFLKATVSEDFPRLMLSREMKRDKCKYFGPFTSGKDIRDTIELLNQLYHLRSCKKTLKENEVVGRTCLYYQIGQCNGVCQGNISREAYREDFDKALKFLQGDTGPVIKKLTNDMQKAADNLDFEQAAVLRDRINSIKKVTQKQKITAEDGFDKDVMAMAKKDDEAVVQVFFIREGKMIGREHYFLTGVKDDVDAEIFSSFIKQMYAGTPYIPKEIWVETDFSEKEVISEWLSARRGNKVNIVVPQKGQKEKMIELAKKNAKIALDKDLNKLKLERERTIGAMEEIQKLLGIDGLVRVESYDISNINGFDTVGSMVVFENGRKKNNDYRKFKIKTVEGPDDYACMEEVLTRRFLHSRQEGISKQDSFKKLPDIIFMDGGKGQVNVCRQVLDNLGFSIPVCGMVKDDRHRTRGLFFNNVEIPIDTHGQAFRLITRIQDETHRFAIEYHKQIRSKGQVHSILDDIKGVGQKRRKALMREFSSIDEIKSADVNRIMSIPEFDEKSARSVVDFFKKG